MGEPARILLMAQDGCVGARSPGCVEATSPPEITMIRTASINKTLRSRHWLATLLTLALLTALALASGAARAADDDPPGRVGRVIESQGESWLYDTDTDEWIQLQRNRPITTGNRIAVDGNARLELRVGSTSLRLAGGSELEIRRLDDERIDLFLVNGSVALRVRSQDVSREIEIATPQGRFTPRRAGHYRVDQRDTTSVATAWNGELHFENDSSALDIASGRSAEFWREANATHYTWAEAQADEFADWVSRANREDDRSGAVTRYVSPEMTGYEDLDRNGRWESHPEYGPGSTMRPGALRRSTTVAGSPSAAAGAGRRAVMWRGPSTRRPWSRGWVAATCTWAVARRSSVGCRWRRAKRITRTTRAGPPTGDRSTTRSCTCCRRTRRAPFPPRRSAMPTRARPVA
jgi:hypothetical protein